MSRPTGLDPNQKHEVRTLIRKMGEKQAIVFSTHIPRGGRGGPAPARSSSDRGRIVANGTPQELKARAATGKLEDFFRSVTRSDFQARRHEKSLVRNQHRRKARARSVLRVSGRVRVPGDLPFAFGILHFHFRRLLRAGRGLARGVLQLAAVAVPCFWCPPRGCACGPRSGGSGRSSSC